MLKNSLLIIILSLSVNVYAETDDWTSYGKDSGGGHYSKARDITPENVHLMEPVSYTHLTLPTILLV